MTDRVSYAELMRLPPREQVAIYYNLLLDTNACVAKQDRAIFGDDGTGGLCKEIRETRADLRELRATLQRSMPPPARRRMNAVLQAAYVTAIAMIVSAAVTVGVPACSHTQREAPALAP